MEHLVPTLADVRLMACLAGIAGLFRLGDWIAFRLNRPPEPPPEGFELRRGTKVWMIGSGGGHMVKGTIRGFAACGLYVVQEEGRTYRAELCTAAAVCERK